MAKRPTRHTAAPPASSPPTTARRRAKKAEPAAAPVDISPLAGTESIESPASHGTAPSASRPPSPSQQEIAEAAYYRYLSRGGRQGNDFDDWVAAERDLRARSGAGARTPAAKRR